jgi:hypothetical protein
MPFPISRVLIGDYLNRYIKPVQIKKHGNKAKSLLKYGLSYIASVLLNAYFQDDIDILKFWHVLRFS